MINSIRKNQTFFIFLLLFLIKGIFYAGYVIPIRLYATPDDVGHYSYLIYLGINHDRPVNGVTKLEKTCFRNFSNFKNSSRTKDKLQSNQYIINETEYEETEKDLNWIAQHPPLYYIYLLPFYYIVTFFTTELYYIIFWMRIATIPLGLLPLYFLYKTMKLLNINKVIINCVLIIFTFSSAIQFYFVAVDNDAMAICISSGAFYFFIKYMLEDKKSDLFIFSALCGGMLITKYTCAVVLPVYVIVYIWDNLIRKKKNMKIFFVNSIICVCIFIVIAGPVLLWNYRTYSNLFGNFMETTDEIKYSFNYFFNESPYLNEISTHILGLIGWNRWVRPASATKTITAIFLIYLMIIKTKFDIRYLVKAIFIIIVFMIMSTTTLNTAIIIAAIVCNFEYEIQQVLAGKKKNTSIYLLSISMVLTFFIVMLWQHYQIFNSRGHTGAMHGRYYYPLILPFFAALFDKYEPLSDHFQSLYQLTPLILFVFCFCSEWYMVLTAFQVWL